MLKRQSYGIHFKKEKRENEWEIGGYGVFGRVGGRGGVGRSEKAARYHGNKRHC